MIDFTVAVDKLAQFETADELADFLRGEGIKGYRCLSSGCPLANWVSIQTQRRIITGDFRMKSGVDVNDSIPHTIAMKEFICKFDDGKYPDLEQGERWSYPPTSGG